MEVIYLNQTDKIKEECVLCLGYFDGLHLGHQKLLDKTIEIANKSHLKKVLLTFSMNPKSYLLNQKEQYLTPLDYKKNFLKAIDFDYIIVVDVDVLGLQEKQFIEQYILNHNIKAVVCGYDFKYGSNRSGNIETLKNYQQFELFVVDKCELDHQRVSSTQIKEFIIKGQIEQANRFLGRPYMIQGKVVHGKKRGKILLGFATANVDYQNYIMPKRGVYGVEVLIENQSYKGMANIGLNPTFGDIEVPTLEVHIFDFDKMIYDQNINVYFQFFVRDEKKFSSFDDLVNQLNQDMFNIKENFIN